MPTPPEQEHFESLCKARFYEHDIKAIREIDQILKDASITAQKCYTKILSSIRYQYHEDIARQKRVELEVVMAEAIPDAFMARKERKAELAAFLVNHASREMIGSHPFSKALWTMLSLQATRRAKGGGGAMCIEWIIEDEVRACSYP